MNGPFFSVNKVYIQELYNVFKQDPEKVDQVWRTFFEKELFDDDAPSVEFLKNFSHVQTGHVLEKIIKNNVICSDTHKLHNQDINEFTSSDVVDYRLEFLKNAYRSYGHFKADLDPLELTKQRLGHEALNPLYHGFHAKDDLIQDVIKRFEFIYCNHIGAEFMHLASSDERAWFINILESPFILSKDHKEKILKQLLRASCFEDFIDKKHRGVKRFGLDGGESLIVILEHIIEYATRDGLEKAAIGMAHRGRLNVLANIVKKPYREILAGFEDTITVDLPFQVSGDVKYHLGFFTEREYNGKYIALALMDNPSHLEAVNTVTLGYIRGYFDRTNKSYNTGMGILIHGDAAFIGQGIVSETMLLAYLKGYTTGGTIHIAENNQIGFTTDSSDSRSSIYCSDLGKMIDAPILHVNGADPEACVRVADIAVKYRQTFHKDIVIDMWCWRKLGHNEGDEPMFTQPVMYKKIKELPVVSESYGKFIESTGDVPNGTLDRLKKEIMQELDIAYTHAKESVTIPSPLVGVWKDFTFAKTREQMLIPVQTGIPEEILQTIGSVLFQMPENFSLNKKIAKQFSDKAANLRAGHNIDWATAELLAFGSLLLEGYDIRLSGEDCQRGTFSQRHAVVFDQENNNGYIPLNSLPGKKSSFNVWNSPLSEFGVLGFEYGYAIACPNSLVIWEAQYGDFANGAQIIIDQFLAAGEQKWMKMCGLVLLLPHGMEGQGPEHSSARLERYLQLSAENNWQVCNITTPANFFHVLRRQLKRSYRKPLIVMSPKSLFRNHLCISRISDMTQNTAFQCVLLDDNVSLKDKDIKRVVLCSGKIYYELFQVRESKNIKNVYLLRIEQLYPFPKEIIAKELMRFKNARIIWCQEESKNNGAWFYIRDHIPVEYVGRKASAAPAVGYASRHAQEQKNLIEQALGIGV